MIMSNPTSDIPNEEVWPPAPTLPEPVRPLSFMTLHPVSYRVLLCVCVSILGAGMEYLFQWFAQASHIIYRWDQIYRVGLTTFIGTLGTQLVILYSDGRAKQKRERKKAALKAKASVAQEATE